MKCLTCKQDRPDDWDCGGDCVLCMADAGDLSCLERAYDIVKAELLEQARLGAEREAALLAQVAELTREIDKERDAYLTVTTRMGKELNALKAQAGEPNYEHGPWRQSTIAGEDDYCSVCLTVRRHALNRHCNPRNALSTPATKLDHCQCPACKDGVLHASDCAVHNEPAYPNGPCDCTPSTPAAEPSKDQLTQLLNGLDRCHVAESKREFLRIWIRDWAAHKTHPDTESVVYQCPRCATSLQVDPTAKPYHPAAERRVPDELLEEACSAAASEGNKRGVRSTDALAIVAAYEAVINAAPAPKGAAPLTHHMLHSDSD